MKQIYAMVAMAAFGLSGCGKNYEEIKKDPLVFTRFDKTEFKPEDFQTDGGSTPQIMRAFKHYSPWGYAKAYIIHDWIFSEHYCGRMEDTSFEESADILSEAIKTMIIERDGEDESEKKVLQTIDAAVRSSFARDNWNTGECIPVDDVGFEAAAVGKPDAVFVVE